MPRRLVVLLSTLLIAACSQAAATDPMSRVDELPADPEAPDIGRAIELAAEATSGRFTFTTSFGDGTEEQVFTELSGAFEEESGRMARAMRFPLIPDEVGLAEWMRVVVDGADVYLWTAVPGGAPTGWLRATGPTDEEALRHELAAAIPGLMDDPLDLAEVLLDAAPLVVEGTEQLHGVEVERHRTTLPVDRLIELVGDDPAGGGIGDILQEVHNPDDPSSVLVWLTPEGSLRRFDLTHRFDGGPDGSLVLRISLDLYDYGEDITIEVPDPSEVQPAP